MDLIGLTRLLQICSSSVFFFFDLIEDGTLTPLGVLNGIKAALDELKSDRPRRSEPQSSRTRSMAWMDVRSGAEGAKREDPPTPETAWWPLFEHDVDFTEEGAPVNATTEKELQAFWTKDMLPRLERLSPLSTVVSCVKC